MQAEKKHHSNNVLYIDDLFEEQIKGLEIIAAETGFEIVGVNNVADGLNFLASNESKVDAVILDYKFPSNEMQGIEALEIIKEKYELLPVIMLTAFDENDDKEKIKECLSKGAFNYVGKLKLDRVYLFRQLQTAVQKYHLLKDSAEHQKLKDEYKLRVPVYEWMLQVTEMVIKNILKDKLMFTPVFEKRVKAFNSFVKKIELKEREEGKINEPFIRITDLAAMRIIFYNSADLVTAVRALQESNDFLNYKDGEKVVGDDKKLSYGYRAVHFDLKLNSEKRMRLEEYQMLNNIACEVQLKTIFAHSWSNVHHSIVYKENGEQQLDEIQQQQLQDDFEKTAKVLESVEEEITKLCEEYFPGKER